MENLSKMSKKQNTSTFNLTDTLTLILHEITLKCSSFVHINMNQVLVCTSSNKRNSRGGIYGKLVPLRFENGSKEVLFRGRTYTMPRVVHQDTEQLYILYFYMPKFFDLPVSEKLRVLFHELYHICHTFNGDIRRMGSVKIAHGHSKKHFDSHFEKEQEVFLTYIKTTPYIKFLEMTSKDIHNTFLKITTRTMKIPKPMAGAACKSIIL